MSLGKNLLKWIIPRSFALASALVSHAAIGQAPTIADLADNNQALVKIDKVHQAIGAAFGMHFISTWEINGILHAYYIRWEAGLGGVGLATSSDGLTFHDQGFVLRAGQAGEWDSSFATFPGVWYEAGIFYLVYEATGHNSRGNIGLATSLDGRNFQKHGIILWQLPYGWESVNIGTPSLYRENGIWYLFYHGFDGHTCQIGVATGHSLFDLQKYAGNPIVRSIPGTWQAGTAGRRDIRKVGAKYYMVYEGSEQQPYETTKWASGIASSHDLYTWSLFSQNAALPQSIGFGNDGPAFVSLAGLNYVYYRSGGATRRALIANDSYGGYDHYWSMQSREIGHVIGRLEPDGGWSVNVLDPQNFMQYGPYTSALAAGDQVATWRLMVDNNSADNLPVVRLEVVDASLGGEVLASRIVTRRQFKQPFRYEYFSVPFTLDPGRAGHMIELRVWAFGVSYVKLLSVGIS